MTAVDRSSAVSTARVAASSVSSAAIFASRRLLPNMHHSFWEEWQIILLFIHL
jgi:hypothetical protein